MVPTMCKSFRKPMGFWGLRFGGRDSIIISVGRDHHLRTGMPILEKECPGRLVWSVGHGLWTPWCTETKYLWRVINVNACLLTMWNMPLVVRSWSRQNCQNLMLYCAYLYLFSLVASESLQCFFLVTAIQCWKQQKTSWFLTIQSLVLHFCQGSR